MTSEIQRTVLITGAGGAIGSVSCSVFAEHGYRVAASDIAPETLDRTVRSVREAGGTIEGFVADISDSSQMEALVSDIKRRFGRIDAAFNNAGIGGFRQSIADVEEDEWDRMTRVNLRGTFLCMKYEIRSMLEQGGGCIVNNCSIWGMRGSGSAPYSATKHGIIGLVRSGAVAYAARGIRINGICPGLLDAGIGEKLLHHPKVDSKALISAYPLGHVGTAADVAQAALWLCSDHANFVHGHLLEVDGGYCAR